MIIKRLKLHNIRSYLDQEVHFPEGSILLAGDIGSGKSTLLLAIEFALFGTKRDELSGEHLLRHGKREGSVELEFELRERETKKSVTVCRCLKRSNEGVKQDAGYIILNGQLQHASPIELKSNILELLGYPKALITKTKDFLYRYTVYTPQEEMKRILSENKEYRLDTIRKVFSIDKYKRVRENAVHVHRMLRTKKEYLEEQLRDWQEKIQQHILLQEQLAAVRQELKTLQLQRSELQQITTQMKEKLIHLEQQRKEYFEIKQLSAVLTQKLEDAQQEEKKRRATKEECATNIRILQTKIASLPSLEVQDNEIEELRKKISLQEKEILSQQMNKKNLDEKQTYLLKDIKQLQKETEMIPTIESQMKELEIETQKIVVQLQEKELVSKRMKETEIALLSFTQKIAEKEAQSNLATSLKEKITVLNTCPTCLQPVTEEHKHRVMTEQETMFQKNNEEKENLLQEKQGIKKQLDECTTQREILQGLEQKKSALEAQISYLMKQIKEKKFTMTILAKKQTELYTVHEELGKLNPVNIPGIETQLEQEKRRCLELENLRKLRDEKRTTELLLSEKMKEFVHQEQELQQLQQKTMEDTTQRDRCLEKLQKIQYNETGYTELQNEYDQKMLLEKNSLVDETRVMQQEKEMVKKVEEITSSIKFKEELNKKLTYLQQVLHWFDEFFILLTSVIEKKMLLRTYHECNRYFTEWFSILVDDEAMQAQLDEEFTPIIVQNGYGTSIENLSGGERTAVALAYRLALNKVINEYVTHINTRDIIILDEPTDGFSTEQLDNVRDVLQQLKMQQIILVSHETKIESFVEHIIRVTKNSHTSCITA